jgi:P4 family phage/plasmid primase-like protien
VTLEQPHSSNLNNWADFWYHEIGVNVIPADTKNKKIWATWSQYQKQPVSLEQHVEWKKQNAYSKGLAIIPGKVWRGPRTNNYLIGIDCDNAIGIEQLLTRNGKTIALKKVAEKFIVEQHRDDPGRAHFYFYSPIPFQDKSPDSVIGIEISSSGEKVLFCSPSTHKGGLPYEVIGIKVPVLLSYAESIEFIQHINQICLANGVPYPSIAINQLNLRKMIKRLKIPLGFSIPQGKRHTTLISLADSLLLTHSIDSKDRLKDFLFQLNEAVCSPPLPDKELDSIWRSAILFVSGIREGESVVNKEELIGIIEDATNTIMKNNAFLTLEETKEILVYKDGVYVPGGEIIIEKDAEKLFGFEISNKHINEIKGHIMRLTFHKRTELDPDLNILNLKNGLYDINKHELKPHTPSYLSVIQNPINYDKNARPKMFGKFLKEVLYPQEIRTAIESLGYTFLKDHPFEYHFKLFGYGSNGKTVFVGIAVSLHGNDCISNVSLSQMLTNRFALADLENKNVNIDTEMEGGIIKDTSIIKKLTAGRRQQLRIERKNQRAYNTYLHAKLFFSANKIPDTTDQTDAYYRREVIITFPNKFEGNSADINLLKKMTTEEEKSGIFNVCMTALRNVLNKGGIYLNEKSIEDRRRKYTRSVNPAKSFIEEANADDITELDYVTKEAMYRAYSQFCKKYKLPLESIESFGKNLKKIGIEDGREGRGERKTYWKKFKLIQEYRLQDGQQHLDQG